MRREVVAVDQQDGIVRIRMSGRPLGHREAAELVDAAEELRDDRRIRVAVLESSGADFCPGAAPDLDPAAFAVDPPAALAALRVPVVAVCTGRVGSVGCELALAADVRVSGADATFSLDDVIRGRLPCWGGTQRLPRVVGRTRATAMILLGDTLDAGTAAAAGMVHRVAAAGDLAAAVDEVVATLRGLAPLALQMAKEAVGRGSELGMVEALHLEGDLNHLLQTTSDRAEGLAAFFDKRDPIFDGT